MFHVKHFCKSYKPYFPSSMWQVVSRETLYSLLDFSSCGSLMFHVKHYDFYRYLFTIPFSLYLVFSFGVSFWSFFWFFFWSSFSVSFGLSSGVSFGLSSGLSFSFLCVLFCSPQMFHVKPFIFIAIRLSQTVTHILQKHFTLSPVVSLYQLYYNIIRVYLREK